VLPNVVAIQWNDAHGTATTLYEAHEIPHAPIVVTSYGLLLRDDATGISIASEQVADGTYRGVTFIPRGMIVSVRALTRHRKPKGESNNGVA